MRSPRRRRPAIAFATAVVCLLAGAVAGDAAADPPPERPAVDLSTGGSQGGLGDGIVDLGGGAEPRTVGTVNPLAIRNPLCDEGLKPAQRRNCHTTGTPEGRYPTSNFGFDVHIDTGLDNVSGNFASMLAQIANAIWTFCLFILNIVLTVLGWAFALSPFSDNSTLHELDSGLQNFYRAFTEPWMVAAMVAIGAWALYRGVVRREVAATLGGTLLTLAMMLVGLWVIFEPRATIGTAAEYTNDAALSVLAAPQAGSISDPVGDYGEATDEVWRTMTLPAFSVLNFSNVDWALSKPDPELLATSNKYACADAAYLAQLPPNKVDEIVFGSEHTGGVGGIGGSDHTTCENLGELVPAPRTNAEIWLRNSPGSLARERLWDQHTDDAPYSSYFAIQGQGGAGTRFPLTLLIGAGLLGGILLLAWLAMRIFVQTAVAFVLVLTTPVALFMPAFGEAGRRAFATWGAALLGALVSKLVYAALLSAVLFATTVVAGLVDGGGGIGATMALLVMAALWWAVFLKRESILSFISIQRQDADGRLGAMLGLYAASRVGRQMLSPVAGTATRGAGRVRDGLAGTGEDRRRATGALARGQLEDCADERLESELAASRQLIGAQGAREAELERVREQRGRAAKWFSGDSGERAAWHRHDGDSAAINDRDFGLDEERGAAREAELRREIASHAGPVASARALAGRVGAREQAGESRFSASERAASRQRLRAELDRPVSDPGHAWRAGMTAEQYAALEGAQRDRVHGEVESQLRSDRRAFGAIPDRPAGLRGWRDARRYRRFELLRRPGGEQALHAERRAATRRRRARQRRAHRGLSR
jgi:hypothetical protein